METISVVLQTPVTDPVGVAHMVDSMVVITAGTVVTTAEMLVERLSVVIVANCVAVGDDWHCDMVARDRGGRRQEYKGGAGKLLKMNGR